MASSITTTIMWVLIFASVLFMHVDETLASDADPISDFCVPDLNSPVKTACKNPLEVKVEDFSNCVLRNPGEFLPSGMAVVGANPTSLPGLNTQGMSFSRLDFKAGGINPPHSHPRASEIMYVLCGKIYAGFVDSTNKIFAKVLGEGELMVFPRGLTHFMHNVGQDNAHVLAIFSSQSPGMQKVSSVVFGSGIDENLLQKAFGLDTKILTILKEKHTPKKV